jgi:hypothetical protein
MFALIGAILFSIMMIMTLLVAIGLPLGEFTMGGQHKILPLRFRIFAIVSMAIQLLAIFIVLQVGGHVPLWFSSKVTKGICIFFAIYLTLNIFMNILSKSKKEKYGMTPLSFFAAICFWVTVFEYN